MATGRYPLSTQRTLELESSHLKRCRGWQSTQCTVHILEHTAYILNHEKLHHPARLRKSGVIGGGRAINDKEYIIN